MKNNKLIYILLVALGIAIGVYFYFKKKNDHSLKNANELLPGQDIVKDTSTNTNGVINNTTITPMPKGTLPFKYGSRGKLVQLMQIVLGVNPDGIWGKGTQAAFEKSGDKIKKIARGGKLEELAEIFAPIIGEKHFPLEIGKNNSSNYVKCLQVIYDLKIDGVYGSNTAKAAVSCVTCSISFKTYRRTVQEFLIS